MGANQVVYNDELFSGEIGQIGTQFDGLGHIGTRIGEEDVSYNGFRLDLNELAADRVYEFAFVFTPLLMKGATGSPGNPLAI